MHHLTTSDLRIGEIGFLVGYREPSAFHRAFSRCTNRTPGEFRTSTRGS
jgi:AraC-like DNA-binding protein